MDDSCQCTHIHCSTISHNGTSLALQWEVDGWTLLQASSREGEVRLQHVPLFQSRSPLFAAHLWLQSDSARTCRPITSHFLEIITFKIIEFNLLEHNVFCLIYLCKQHNPNCLIRTLPSYSDNLAIFLFRRGCVSHSASPQARTQSPCMRLTCCCSVTSLDVIFGTCGLHGSTLYTPQTTKQPPVGNWLNSSFFCVWTCGWSAKFTSSIYS